MEIREVVKDNVYAVEGVDNLEDAVKELAKRNYEIMSCSVLLYASPRGEYIFPRGNLIVVRKKSG